MNFFLDFLAIFSIPRVTHLFTDAFFFLVTLYEIQSQLTIKHQLRKEVKNCNQYWFMVKPQTSGIRILTSDIRMTYEHIGVTYE